MITFKKFVEEVQYDEMDFDDIINIINTKCKDAMWMIHSNSPLFRGDKSLINYSGFPWYSVIDPSKTERSSAHTTNHYTVILDNTPSMQGFPKRSKSLICTTWESKARDFSGSGDPFIIIPFDNVDIGVVNSGDMWDIEIELFGGRPREIDRINRLWDKLGLPTENASWPKWIKFAEACNGPKAEEYQNKITQAISDCHYYDMLRSNPVEQIASNLLSYIDIAYSPKNTGVSLATTSDRHDFEQTTEVWVGGPCLMMTKKAWFKVCAHYVHEEEE